MRTIVQKEQRAQLRKRDLPEDGWHEVIDVTAYRVGKVGISFLVGQAAPWIVGIGKVTLR